MDCWVTGRCAAKLIGGRGLFDGSLIDFSSDANSVNEEQSNQTLYIYAYTYTLLVNSSQTKRYSDSLRSSYEVMQ